MRILSLMTSVCLAIATISHSETRTLSIATGSYAPFTGQDLPGEGIVNQSVRNIAKNAGFEISFDYMPWKRTLEATRRGMYDATSYWYYSEMREPHFIHVGPVMREREVFFTIADSDVPNWNSLEDLSGLRIGVVPGYTYTPQLWEMGESGRLTLSEATSDEANLRKLLAGRIDVYPMSETAGWHLISELFSESEQARLRVLDTPLVISGGYLLVSRSKPDAEAVAQALQIAVDAAEIQLSN
ncbi:ABC transporter substrate-binding protein [uncultured Roseovarius sp.]|uniref:substrate-binding periplasmic protein n=1 Tax=uncultured Roseovarius sp. TaxID=293344 RepID=UPI00260460DD|nr:transporter substrate-binding domain-containing protein [uncultured Roseovarius sp.]